MEKQSSNNYLLSRIVAVIIAIVIVVVGYFAFYQPPSVEMLQQYYEAEVIEVLSDDIQTSEDYYGEEIIVGRIIKFNARITSEPASGQQVEAEQHFDIMLGTTPREVEAGDKIVLTQTTYDSALSNQFVYVQHNRIPLLIGIVALFFILVLIIGRSKGLFALLSLGFTVALMLLVFLPAVLKGMNIYFLTCVTAIIVIILSLIILNGTNKKTLSAIIGNVGGVLVAGIMSVIANNVFNIVGIASQEDINLLFLPTGVQLDLKGIVFAGVVIGALGAVMDVAMTIASSMQELSETMMDKSFKNMVYSGMNIGKDAIGTMINTLILAYIGSSLATVLLLTSYNPSALSLFNLEMVTIEIVKSVIGSIGIIIAVPITVLFSSFIFNDKEVRGQYNDNFTIGHQDTRAIPTSARTRRY